MILITISRASYGHGGYVYANGYGYGDCYSEGVFGDLDGSGSGCGTAND